MEHTNERYVVIKQVSGNIVDYTVIDLKDDTTLLITASKEHAEAKARFFNANHQDVKPNLDREQF